MYIRLQNYGTGKHLRWSPNSCPSPNGYNTCDFVICGWYLLGCFQGPLMIKSLQALQILAYIFCPINFPSCYFFFSYSLVLQASLVLQGSLPCTSSLFFCCLLHKGADSVFPSDAQPLLAYSEVRGHNSFFSDAHYFFANLVINGLRSSSITLSPAFWYRF